MSQVGMTYSSWENHAATPPGQFNANLNQSSPSHHLALGHLGGGGGGGSMVEQLDTSRGSDASGGDTASAASAVTTAAAEASGVGPDDTPPVCGGCRLRIVDKFFLCALDQKWHSSCLKCSQCGVPLEQQMAFFRHEDRLYCKEDYSKIVSSRKFSLGGSNTNNNVSFEHCSRCRGDIGPTDLVMKARSSVFHVECFRCAKCDCPLKKGDMFGMTGDSEDHIYCQYHFSNLQQPNEGQTASSEASSLDYPPPSHPPPPPPPASDYRGHAPAYPPYEGTEQPYPHTSPHSVPPPHPYHPHHLMHHMPYGGYPPQHPTSGLTKEGSDHGDIGGGVGWPPYPPPHDPSGGLDGVGPPGTGGGGNPSFYPGDGSGSEAGSAAGGSSGASKKTKRGRKKRNRIPPPMHSGPGGLDEDDYGLGGGSMWGVDGGLDGMGQGGSMGKNTTKRARTSFKHNQLRIMRSHFQINQNPDSRELKMLSQKTGLDKKVLQVWFQNSRAKWRRSQSDGGVVGAPGSGAPPSGAASGADPHPDDQQQLGAPSTPAAEHVPPPMSSPMPENPHQMMHDQFQPHHEHFKQL